MTFAVTTFAPDDEDQVLALSLRAWAPVFERLEPAVPSYVYRAFYPLGWRTRQAADIVAFLRVEGRLAWIRDTSNGFPPGYYAAWDRTLRH